MGLNSTIRSAFYGQPPNTDRDLDIVRGIFRMAGVNDTVYNPSKGVYYAPRQPAHYVHENIQTQIVIGMAVCIVVMHVTTAARLIFKLQGNGRRFGMDDLVIIPAVVSDSALVDQRSMLTLNIVPRRNLPHVTDIHGCPTRSWATLMGKYL